MNNAIYDGSFILAKKHVKKKTALIQSHILKSQMANVKQDELHREW